MTPTSARNRYAAVLGWLVLLLAGQAASLLLISAGHMVGYQHYRFVFSDRWDWIGAAVLVLQALLVAAGLRSRWGTIAAWTSAHLSRTRLLVLLLAVGVTSATVSRSPMEYGTELLVAFLVQLIAIGNVILVVWASSETRGAVDRIVGQSSSASYAAPRTDVFALAAACWVVVVSAILAVYSYQQHPHVPDEVVYLLHARYLAEGMLTMPAPPAPLAFNIDLMQFEATRWYSPVPPGWPFVLAAGVWAGVPWLVNPILGGLNILLAHRVLSEMYDRSTARLATLFLALSPWFVFMSMNIMTHQATLFFALLAALAVSRMRRRRLQPAPFGWSDAFAALGGGAAIGAVSLVRPLEGLATALLLGVWSLPPQWWGLLSTRFSGRSESSELRSQDERHLLRGGWSRIRQFVPSALLTVGAIASGAMVRPYNAMITGDPSYFPIMAYIDNYYAKGSNDLGFGPNRGLGWTGLDPFPGHGAADVVVNANLNITTTNTELLGWATGSLLPIFLLFAFGRIKRADWWHVAVLAVIAGVHSFYWFSGGPDFGARYWFLIVVSCTALAARGVMELGETMPGARSDADVGPNRAVRGALALCVVALLTFFPWRAIDKYYHYRNMRPDIREMARNGQFGNSLVFIRGNRHPDYASAAPYNPLDLNAEVPLYVWDSSREAREQALEAYPERNVWFVDGPTRTGDGFRIVAGPLSAAQARTQPYAE